MEHMLHLYRRSVEKALKSPHMRNMNAVLAYAWISLNTFIFTSNEKYNPLTKFRSLSSILIKNLRESHHCLRLTGETLFENRIAKIFGKIRTNVIQ